MATTATGSRSSTNYIAESTYGTTPATPAFQEYRVVSNSLGISKSNSTSNEIREDSQIEFLRHGNKVVGGSMPIELSDGTHDDIIEALLGGTWAANVVKVGNTRRSFTFENKFNNITTPEYHRFTGSEPASLSLSIQPDSIVTGDLNFVCQDYSNATSAIAGASYAAPTNTQPFDSFNATINEGGSPILVVTALEFTIDRGLNRLNVVGSDTTLQPSKGKFVVTGNLTILYQDKALVDKFINETASNLDITLTDPSANTLKFDFPNIKYTGAEFPIPGDGELTVSLPFQALYDTTAASTIVITRG